MKIQSYRIIILYFLLVCSYQKVKAQNNGFNPTSQTSQKEYKSVFNGNTETQISGFFAVLNNFTVIDKKFGHLFGIGGAVTINDFFLGGYIMGLTNAIQTNESVTGKYIQLDHGGFWLGYSGRSNAIVHPAFHVKTGWGSLRAADHLGFQTSENSTTGESTTVFLVSPSLDVEANLTPFVRVVAGVYYNWTGNVSLGDYANKDFSNPGAHITLKIGKFSK